MTNDHPFPPKTLYLDHWPPTVAEIADGFALIEKMSERVEKTTLRLRDLLTSHAEPLIDDRGNGVFHLWGVESQPQMDEPTDTARIIGEFGTTVFFKGPGAGPALEPYHVTEPPKPPIVPTDADLATLQRFSEHATTDDFVVTAREYVTLRKFARDQIDVETAATILKTGVVAYKVWTDNGAEMRATVRILRTTVPTQNGE